MDRETLISIINKNGIRFLPVRRCSLCDEYIATGIVTSIKSKDVVEFYVENPFVKIKDE